MPLRELCNHLGMLTLKTCSHGGEGWGVPPASQTKPSWPILCVMWITELTAFSGLPLDGHSQAGLWPTVSATQPAAGAASKCSLETPGNPPKFLFHVNSAVQKEPQMTRKRTFYPGEWLSRSGFMPPTDGHRLNIKQSIISSLKIGKHDDTLPPVAAASKPMISSKWENGWKHKSD